MKLLSFPDSGCDIVCQNGGTCYRTGDEKITGQRYRCTCLGNYVGEYCEISEYKLCSITINAFTIHHPP